MGQQTTFQYLDRLGGRAAWAGLRNTINGSQQNRADEPTVVYAVITMDFERPRFRIETTAQDLHLIRVIDGDNNWRLNRAGEIEDVPADRELALAGRAPVARLPADGGQELLVALFTGGDGLGPHIGHSGVGA